MFLFCFVLQIDVILKEKDLTMQFNQHQIDDIQKKLQDSLRVIKMYEWLLDSYVLVSRPVYSKNLKKSESKFLVDKFDFSKR